MRAYRALAAVLFALMVSETVVQCRHGAWSGDFWEHSAVVRELARHLVHPRHPLLALPVKHEFFSPYSLALGAATRVTHLSPVWTLGLAGLCNLALLLALLPPFVRLFTRRPLAPFFTLLFTLLLWGVHPLVFSGFFHFDVIGLVLPYPSTFATAVTLGLVVLWSRQLAEPRHARLAVIAIGSAVVLLTHPVAAFFLVLLLLAFSRGRAVTRLGVVAATMLVAALVWPYYPFFRLLREEGVFDASNHPLYQSVFGELLPVLPAFVLVALRLRRDRLDPLALTVLVIAIVYGAGAATSHWSLGRVLPYGVLLLDVALADRAAALPWAPLLTAAVVALAIPVMHLHDPFFRALPFTTAGRPEAVGDEYSRLFSQVPRASVTMASAPVGWPVPTYGGRIVDPLHPQAFVGDLAQRHRDAVAFFDPGTTNAARRRLLCRYRATYVLSRSGETPIELGTVAAADGPYVLRRVLLRCAA